MSGGFLPVTIDEAAELLSGADVNLSRDDLISDMERGAPISDSEKFDLLEYLAWLVLNG
jgi:hypothetical protein